MLRIAPFAFGLGLAVLWVVGLTDDAAAWLTWAIGLLAVATFASTGLVPARRSGLSAWVAHGLVTAALFGLWTIGRQSHATPWLVWWTFVFALAAAAMTLLVGAQELLDRIRVRPLI